MEEVGMDGRNEEEERKNGRKGGGEEGEAGGEEEWEVGVFHEGLVSRLGLGAVGVSTDGVMENSCDSLNVLSTMSSAQELN